MWGGELVVGVWMDKVLEEYRQKLAAFDWQYAFSDDHSVYLRGKDQQRALFGEAMELGPEAMELYFNYVKASSV